MINEEDHLRMQVMQSGFNLFEAWNIINRIDDCLANELSFAFLAEWGYLTACPTNTGIGMRGSVMLHLPALVMTRQIDRVLAAISKLSFTSRGLYGEGTQAMGNY
jgi:protein arginine kinase